MGETILSFIMMNVMNLVGKYACMYQRFPDDVELRCWKMLRYVQLCEGGGMWLFFFSSCVMCSYLNKFEGCLLNALLLM